MLPADLDDEQRAHLAHEHPTDVDSSPSSPSSGIPSFFDPRRRPKSASRHRSRTTTTDESSSSHLLARLISREEELREVNAALAVANERLEAESSRANAAERRALDYFHRLRIATDNREHAEQESARLREELKLYKMQLENAQKEIFRAQDIIDQVASQRNEAEAEAARARTKARKLQEEKLVMFAREEGRRMGYREGLSIGRRIGYDEGRGRRLVGPSDRLPHYPFSPEYHDGDESAHEHAEGITDDERDDPRAQLQLRSRASSRQQLTRPESAPPVRMPETTVYAPPLPVRINTPSQGHRTPSPPRAPDEPETINPIPIRPSPIIPIQPINSHHDGWIPRADSRTSYIPVLPPYELQQRVPSSPGSVADELRDRQQSEPMPVPPPIRSRDYAYQTPVPPPPVPRGQTPSLASRTSTHISQYDLVNKRPGSSLRNEIYFGRARSGSQPSRESTSRNEHRDPDWRNSGRTEAEGIAEKWRADSDDSESPPLRNPPRSFTPSAPPRSHRPVQFYYRPGESATPGPPRDADALASPRSHTPVPTDSTAMQLRPPPIPEDAATHTVRSRTPLDHLRKRFRQRPASNSSIPNIIVESPSEPETTMSPSGTIAAQPDLLSPEAANRPLPQDDSTHQPHHHHHHHQHHNHSSHSYSQPPPQPPPSQYRRTPSSSYDAPQRSGTPYAAAPSTSASGSTPWPAGFIPYPRGSGAEPSSARSRPDRDTDRDRDHDRDRDRDRDNKDRDRRRAYTDSNTRPPEGYTRARTQSASASSLMVPTSMAMVRTAGAGGAYETAPLPPGVTYPAPPVRPHTSHRQYREGDRERERVRDVGRAWDWERERDRERDRRQDSGREYEHERERERNSDRRERERDQERDREQERRTTSGEDTGVDEVLTRSPAPLQRPISLFDSDEA